MTIQWCLVFTFQVSEVAQELSLSILAPPCCSFFFFTVWFVCNLSFLLLLIHRLLGRFMVSFLTNFTFSSSTSPASNPSGNQHTLIFFVFLYICLFVHLNQLTNILWLWRPLPWQMKHKIASADKVKLDSRPCPCKSLMHENLSMHIVEKHLQQQFSKETINFLQIFSTSLNHKGGN